MSSQVFHNNKMMEQDLEVSEDVEVIKGYEFALFKPIFLQSPKNKFWEVTVEGSEVRYRAGVLRGDSEHKIKEVLKQYDSRILARANAITKIAQKIDKGYFSKTAHKLQQSQSDSRPVRRRKILQPASQSGDDTAQTIVKVRKPRASKAVMQAEIKDPHKTLWKGLQKGKEVIEFDVKGNQLKTTKRSGDEEASQVKMLPSYDAAVNLVHRKEKIMLSQGFQPIVTETFLGQFTETTRKGDSTIPNPFSHSNTTKALTKLTDLALESNFSSNSQQAGDNVYLPIPRLGPPIDSCIKCLLAQNYKEGTDPTGWIMSQKLDGVRCLWTGSQMYSRNGNKFYFPKFFTKNWPKCQLDGQIFIGRGKFSQTISAVKKNVAIQSEWHQLRYLVFDAPGLKQPFRIRIKILQEELAKVENPYIKCHPHRPCQGYKDLFSELEAVNQIGGEGIMLRQPEALYENKRSKNLQKVKTFHDDEAQIIGYTDGTGRCTGWIGALRVRNGKGIEFEVGSGLNDQMRQNPPEIGQKITYKYQEFNKQSGKPRFPTLLRIHTSI